MSIPTHLREQIETIAKHEENFAARRTPAERIADRIAGFAGSFNFVLLHLAFFAVWMILNTSRHFIHFDPSPFALLDTIVALEAILLASVILMRQSVIGKRTDERDHLMLQMLLLSEKELSVLIRMNRELAGKLNLPSGRDKEIQELAEPTPIDSLAQTIQENLTTE